MTQEPNRGRDWQRSQWEGDQGEAEHGGRTEEASEERATTASSAAGTPGEGPGERWNESQWAGDQGEGAPVEDVIPSAGQTHPGEPIGPTGGGHTSGTQDWAHGRRDPREPGAADTTDEDI